MDIGWPGLRIRLQILRDSYKTLDQQAVLDFDLKTLLKELDFTIIYFDVQLVQGAENYCF
jgi:hypothetical protein